MQRYSFFAYLQNFWGEMFEFYLYFNSCLQITIDFACAHIIYNINPVCKRCRQWSKKAGFSQWCNNPLSASLRNFYTFTRRHCGKMSLTEGAAVCRRRHNLALPTTRHGVNCGCGGWNFSCGMTAKGRGANLPIMEWLLCRLQKTVGFVVSGRCWGAASS